MITNMFSAQNAKKQIHLPPGSCDHPGTTIDSIEWMACGHVSSAHAERCSHEDGEGNSVSRAGMRVEQHRHQNDQVSEQDCADRLPPVHAAGNQP
jgi:hypothetical protein